jgi:hypothetical protein
VSDKLLYPTRNSAPLRSVPFLARERGVAVHILDDIIRINTSLKISRLDGHPNAKANEMIADYLVKEIIIE